MGFAWFRSIAFKLAMLVTTSFAVAWAANLVIVGQNTIEMQKNHEDILMRSLTEHAADHVQRVVGNWIGLIALAAQTTLQDNAEMVSRGLGSILSNSVDMVMVQAFVDGESNSPTLVASGFTSRTDTPRFEDKLPRDLDQVLRQSNLEWIGQIQDIRHSFSMENLGPAVRLPLVRVAVPFKHGQDSQVLWVVGVFWGDKLLPSLGHDEIDVLVVNNLSVLASGDRGAFLKGGPIKEKPLKKLVERLKSPGSSDAPISRFARRADTYLVAGRGLPDLTVQVLVVKHVSGSFNAQESFGLLRVAIACFFIFWIGTTLVVVLSLRIRRRLQAAYGNDDDLAGIPLLDSDNAQGGDEIHEITRAFRLAHVDVLKKKQELAALRQTLETLQQSIKSPGNGEKLSDQTSVSREPIPQKFLPASEVDWSEVAVRCLVAVPGEEKCLKFQTFISRGKHFHGEWFGHFSVDSKRQALIAVSPVGQGIVAAVQSAMVYAAWQTIHTFASHGILEGLQPSDLLTILNRVLIANSKAPLQAAALAIIIDTESGLMEHANAAFPFPVLMPSDPGDPRIQSGIGLFELQGTDAMLGLSPETTFADYQSMLRAGDRVLLYSDGIIGNVRSENANWGKPRFFDILSRLYQHDLAEAMKAVTKSWHGQVGGEPIHDDATMLLIEVDKTWKSNQQVA